MVDKRPSTEKEEREVVRGIKHEVGQEAVDRGYNIRYIPRCIFEEMIADVLEEFNITVTHSWGCRGRELSVNVEKVPPYFNHEAELGGEIHEYVSDVGDVRQYMSNGLDVDMFLNEDTMLPCPGMVPKNGYPEEEEQGDKHNMHRERRKRARFDTEFVEEQENKYSMHRTPTGVTRLVKPYGTLREYYMDEEIPYSDLFGEVYRDALGVLAGLEEKVSQARSGGIDDSFSQELGMINNLQWAAHNCSQFEEAGPQGDVDGVSSEGFVSSEVANFGDEINKGLTLVETILMDRYRDENDLSRVLTVEDAFLLFEETWNLMSKTISRDSMTGANQKPLDSLQDRDFISHKLRIGSTVERFK